MPLVSYATPPAPSLRLVGVRTGAAQDLRHRSWYIAVADSLGETEGATTKTVDYLARVAELATHSALPLPGDRAADNGLPGLAAANLRESAANRDPGSRRAGSALLTRAHSGGGVGDFRPPSAFCR